MFATPVALGFLRSAPCSSRSWTVAPRGDIDDENPGSRRVPSIRREPGASRTAAAAADEVAETRRLARGAPASLEMVSHQEVSRGGGAGDSCIPCPQRGWGTWIVISPPVRNVFHVKHGDFARRGIHLTATRKSGIGIRH